MSSVQLPETLAKLVACDYSYSYNRHKGLDRKGVGWGRDGHDPPLFLQVPGSGIFES